LNVVDVRAIEISAYRRLSRLVRTDRRAVGRECASVSDYALGS
jgi:hypothetical protein